MTDFKQQHKVFYGWWIVGALFFISAYAQGIIFYGFTSILEPIVNDFAWSYTQVSIAASLRGMETGLLAPLVGFLVDRWGARRPVFAGIVIIGLGLVLLSRINSIWTFYGVFILLSIGLSMCGISVVMAVVGNWFRRNVAIATGIAISGSAIGGLMVPLATRMIDILDWRAAMIILGLGAWVILLPLSLVVRHKPEQYGYFPDGDMSPKPVPSEGLTPVQSTEVDIRVRQALKSRAFWHFSLGFVTHTFVVSSVITHIMPYLSSIGIARTMSSLVASALPIISILGRISFGWFGDKYDKRWVTALGFTMTIISMLLLGYSPIAGTWLLVPFVIFFGIGFGGPVTMSSALMREYFGRARLGTILGLIQGIMMIGNITGPPLAGWVYDTFGSYQGAWFYFTGLVIFGIVGFLTAPSVGNTCELQVDQKNTN